MSSRSTMFPAMITALGLLFGSGCGDKGTSVSNGSGGATGTGANGAPATVAGIWSGTLSSGASPVGVRFVIQDQSGQLSGQGFFEDPVTLEFVADADFTGALDGANATWKTSTDLAIVGKFDGTTFTGTLEFPPDGDLPPHVTKVSLTQ
jgi:hypothetical protein